MNNKKRNFLISGILLLIAITFTILVKVVDVKQIGVNNSSIGFATLNQFIFETTGVNMIWYHITDWLGLISVFMAIVYAFIGLIQFIKRRSIFKVDKEIILLGLYYIIVIALYVFFEKVIINYLSIIIITITVVGRLISGVHWFTDIIGGILISSGLLMTFYSLLSIINKENY